MQSERFFLVNKSKPNVTGIILFLLVFSTTLVSVHSAILNTEWEVEIGDQITYLITEFDDHTNSESDTQNQIRFPITTEEGELIEVTLEKGSRIIVEIRNLSCEITDHTMIKIVYDNSISEKERCDNYTLGISNFQFVVKTTMNQSYWISENQPYNVSFEGNHVLLSAEADILFLPICKRSGRVRLLIKRDMTTGWLVNWSMSVIFDDEIQTFFELLAEHLLTTTDEKTMGGDNIPVFVVLIIIFTLIISAIFLAKRFQ